MQIPALKNIWNYSKKGCATHALSVCLHPQLAEVWSISGELKAIRFYLRLYLSCYTKSLWNKWNRHQKSTPILEFRNLKFYFYFKWCFPVAYMRITLEWGPKQGCLHTPGRLLRIQAKLYCAKSEGQRAYDNELIRINNLELIVPLA